MKSKCPIRFVAVSILISMSLCSYVFADMLVVKQAYVPESPPTARVMAAYMSLHNPTDQAKHITHLSSPQFDRIEMHQSTLEEGVVRMLAVDKIEIPAQQTVELKPGGRHLMLFHPKARYRHGDLIKLVLHYADGHQQTVPLPVEKRAVSHDHSHH